MFAFTVLRHYASFLQGIVGFESCMFLLYNFIHLFTPPPGFKFLLVVIGETRDCGDGRGSFISDQADSTWLAVSASAPAAVPTAATEIIVFTLKDDWNWLALAGSLSFQVQMQGENSRFFTWVMWAMKSHITMWCC